LTFEQVTQYLSWTIYTLIFCIVTVKAIRRPTRANVDIALFFTMPAAVIALTIAGNLKLLTPDPLLSTITGSLLFIMGYLLFRLVDDFAVVPVWLSRAALAGLVLCVLSLFVFAPKPPGWVSILQIIYLSALFVYSVVEFIAASRRASGVTHRRMRVAALGSFALVVLFLLAGLQVVVPQWTGVTRPIIDLAGLFSAVAYFLGFATPGIFRRAWQEPELRSFLGRAASLPSLPDTRSIIRELEHGAASSLGAPNARIGLWDDHTQRIRFDMGDQELEADPERSIAARVFASQRANFSENVYRDNPSAAELHRAYGPAAALIAPVTAGEKRLGVLSVYAPRAPIFAEEDLALVQLLADQAAVILESRALIDEATRVQAREEVTRLKEDFLSAAAHDLKTPLTTLVMQVELLERRALRAPDAPADLESLQRLKHEAHRLKSLVLELLDAARAEQGRLIGEREQTNLVEVAQEICARHTTPLHPCRVEASGPIIGEYDSSRVQQLLENLVENAVKYSPDGGPVTISMGRQQATERGVAVAGGNDAGKSDMEWNHLAVVDSGIGIPKEDLPHVFERFHRGTNVDDRQFAGMGLGLYICRGIVEQHGGRIWVESPPSSSSRHAGASVGSNSSLEHRWSATSFSTNGSGDKNDIKDTNGNAATNNTRGTAFHILLPASPATISQLSKPVGAKEEPGQ
jgi:signal transduction histidine kinase